MKETVKSVLDNVVYTETKRDLLNLVVTTATLKLTATVYHTLSERLSYPTIDFEKTIQENLRREIAEQIFRPIRKTVEDLMEEVEGELKYMAKDFYGYDSSPCKDRTTRMFMKIMHRKLGEIMDMLY